MPGILRARIVRFVRSLPKPPIALARVGGFALKASKDFIACNSWIKSDLGFG